jgi:hypothetical protein
MITPTSPNGPLDNPADDIEWLDVGPRGETRRGETQRGDHLRTMVRQHPRLTIAVVVLAAAVLAAAAGTAVSASTHHPRHVAATLPTRTTNSSSVATSASPQVVQTPTVHTGPPVETDLTGPPLLGADTGWDLFLLGPTDVTRVRPALGKVYVTPGPELNAGASLSFLVGGTRAIVRSSNVGPGFVVPDAQAAADLPADMNAASAIFPGPASDEYWLEQDNPNGPSLLQLVDANGRRLGQRITLPVTLTGPVLADGAGYVIAEGLSGAYDARPAGLRRITVGQVVAVGPSSWLAEECDDVGQCRYVIVDQATWTSQNVGPTTSPIGFVPGVVSPDSKQAVVVGPRPGGRRALYLIDMKTGRTRMLAEVPDASLGDQIVQFSPDSRYLFVVGSGGSFHVLDSQTLAEVRLGVKLPPVIEVAIRN